MYYIDGDENIIVPKSIRPIIDCKQTCLGDKRGANRQFRVANLHIREYDNHYTVHKDKIDPRTDPVGHLLVDAPEYLTATLSAVSMAKQVCNAVYSRRRAEGKNQRIALCDALIAGYITGSTAGTISYIINNIIKKMKGSI